MEIKLFTILIIFLCIYDTEAIFGRGPRTGNGGPNGKKYTLKPCGGSSSSSSSESYDKGRWDPKDPYDPRNFIHPYCQLVESDRNSAENTDASGDDENCGDLEGPLTGYQNMACPCPKCEKNNKKDKNKKKKDTSKNDKKKTNKKEKDEKKGKKSKR